mmetsp:Transcript_67043/g.143451  ORF Transcript_67043/g.143451 Transcript_67043/m.143451 type:complete len:189 (+) Transcript_67043:50-616(+)
MESLSGPLAPAAGMSTLRQTARAREMRKAVNTKGTIANGSRETLRTLTAHSLLATRDQMFLKGAARSHELRATQEHQQVPDYPTFMTRSLSDSSVVRWAPNPPADCPYSPAEVVASGHMGIRLRASLPPAGVKSEVADKEKVANFSAVEYVTTAEQATPISRYDRTAFMSLAHRDPTAPGVWLPPTAR